MLDLRVVKLPCGYSASLLVGNALGSLVQSSTTRDGECANTACKPLVLARNSDAAECNKLRPNFPKAGVPPVLVGQVESPIAGGCCVIAVDDDTAIATAL